MMTSVMISTNSLFVVVLSLVLLLGLSDNSQVWGWTSNARVSMIHSRTISTTNMQLTAMNNDDSIGCSNASMSRRNVLQQMTAATAAAGLTGSATMITTPAPAYADVTNKVASTTALRNLQRCNKTLPKLSTSVTSNDYVGVKSFMRTPPWDEARKNGQILVRGGEDLGEKATELSNKYKTFIASVEKIDGTASLGIRGRTIDPKQLVSEYDSVQTALADFIKVAEETVVLPLQYPSDNDITTTSTE